MKPFNRIEDLHYVDADTGGSYWIFYRTFSDGTQSTVYCFFVPIPSM